MPDSIAQVAADVDAREHDIDATPLMDAERHAIGRRTVHTVGIQAIRQGRGAIAERQRRGDGVTGGRSLHVRGEDADVAKGDSRPREGGDPGAVDPVVVADQDAHVMPPIEVAMGGEAETADVRPMLQGGPVDPSWPPRHIVLIHNTGAGDASPPADLLSQMLSEAGYQARYRSTDEAWQEALQPPLDLVVAVGGDGTVGKVARAVMGTRLPFAILPVGTANNIAKTLGVMGDALSVARAWRHTRPRVYDVWGVSAARGHDTFVESFGAGFLSRTIASAAALHPPTLILGGSIDRALFVLRQAVAEAPERPWHIELDGQDLSGDYIGVEALNIRSVGPNLPLAPDADPGDSAIDLVLVSAADRDELGRRLHEAATAQTPAALRLPVRRGRRLSMRAPADLLFHIDDDLWPPATGKGAGDVPELCIEIAGHALTLAPSRS
jgi:diacylglycerol kinase (ATP)